MKQKAFTLIELLVVIAIIGLLTTLVLVNTSGTRGKARVAKALEYSGQIHNALGSELVGSWNFDNGTGTVAYDTSGYGDNGTLINGPVYATDTPYGVVGAGTGKYSLSFDGSNDYVNIPYSSVLNLASPWTISVWAKHNSVSSPTTQEYVRGIRWAGGTNYYLLMESGLFTAAFNNLAGSWATARGPDTAAASVWYNVVGTWDGTKLTCYVNGSAGTPFTPGYIPDVTIDLTRIGLVDAARPMNGLIDDVRIYSVALTASQIQQHYAEGLEKHQNLAIE